MSVFYDIREHLQVRKNTDSEECGNAVGIECADNMSYRLAALAAPILYNDAGIDELRMIADGETYVFSGREITPEYKKIITALCEAEEVDITVRYYCNAHVGGISDIALPFGFTEYLDKQSEDDMRGVFYSMWNAADCSDGPGILSAYGEKDGRYFKGIVDFEEVASCPEGNWRSTDTVIILDDDSVPVTPEVIKACEAFKELTDDAENDVDVAADEKGLYFALNNLSIESPEKCERFLKLVADLHGLVGDVFGTMANFVDESGPDAKLMEIDPDTGSAPVIKVARV